MFLARKSTTKNMIKFKRIYMKRNSNILCVVFIEKERILKFRPSSFAVQFRSRFP